MRGKATLSGLMALVAIVGASLVAYRWEAASRPAMCQICGRNAPKQTEFRLETDHGAILACCPTCAIHYMSHHPGSVRKAMATDLGSGHMIPASSAYYDEGGDVQYCTATHSPVERGPQGVSQRVYDRCLPILVAFATRNEAETYRQQHGGRILTYDQAMESVHSQ